jgi:hypothetical protein
MADDAGKSVYQFIPEETDAAKLAEMLRVYAQLYMALDGFWYLAVMNRFDNDMAVELDIQVWRKLVKYEMDLISKTLQIGDNSLASALRGVTASPWFRNMEFEIDFTNENRAALTVIRCPTLLALEKEGTGRESRICRDVDNMLFQLYAEYFNPATAVTALSLPPRDRKEGFCCKWEFKLD